MTASLPRNGAAAMTGNLNAGSYKVTSLGNGTAATDGVNKKQLDEATGGTLSLAGTATAYTLTLNTAPASLDNGLTFWAKANVTNTGGATTLVVTPSGGSAFSSKKVKMFISGSEADPPAGVIVANNHYAFTYDSSADSGTGAYILKNPTQTPISSNVLEHGGCRLEYTNATTITLSLVNGGRLIIDGTSRQLTSTTFVNTSFTISTLQFVYAYWTGSAVAYEISTTSHTTHTNGVEIKSGDSTRTLIGAVYRGATGDFFNTDLLKGVASWFNRRARLIGTTHSGASTSSTTTVLVGGPSYGIVWGGETVDATHAGSATPAGGTVVCIGSVTFTGITASVNNESNQTAAAGAWAAIIGKAAGAPASTALISIGQSARVSSNSATFYGACTAVIWG